MEPTPETHRKIVAGEPADEEKRRLACPWCDSPDVEKVSEYGPHLMVYSYICRDCNSPFEVIKR
jgi:ring-1,2-phenylacetyl-CoA epoxidase subunit PaaD